MEIYSDGTDMTLMARDQIILHDGFHAHAGSTITAKISPCMTLRDGKPEEDSSYLQQQIPSKDSTVTTSTENKKLTVYPNPTAGHITVEVNLDTETQVNLSIIDFIGQRTISVDNGNVYLRRYDIV